MGSGEAQARDYVQVSRKTFQVSHQLLNPHIPDTFLDPVFLPSCPLGLGASDKLIFLKYWGPESHL